MQTTPSRSGSAREWTRVPLLHHTSKNRFLGTKNKKARNTKQHIQFKVQKHAHLTSCAGWMTIPPSMNSTVPTSPWPDRVGSNVKTFALYVLTCFRFKIHSAFKASLAHFRITYYLFMTMHKRFYFYRNEVHAEITSETRTMGTMKNAVAFKL